VVVVVIVIVIAMSVIVRMDDSIDVFVRMSVL
jgi:hypothetical protein